MNEEYVEKGLRRLVLDVNSDGSDEHLERAHKA